MPKYNNSTTADIVVGSYRFPANSDFEVSSYVEGALPAGLTLLSVEPNDAMQEILSEKYGILAGATEPNIVVPASDGGEYTFKFYVESGEYRINFNEVATVAIGRLIAEGNTWSEKFTSRMVDFVSIHCIIGGTIYMTVTKG